MKKTLEQQLIDKCEELSIDLNMGGDSIWVDLTTHHMFGTNSGSWEHCIVRGEDEWHFDEQMNGQSKKQYNYKTEYNTTIRIILEAIDTIEAIPEDECCENEACAECYEDAEVE